MNNELLNILSNSNKDIDNQKLMDYLSGKLPAEEKHELEKQMLDSEMMNDAVEGLQHFENKKGLQAYVEQLNEELHKNLNKKKNRKQKRRLRDQPWLLMTIVIILALIIISYVIIKTHLDNERQPKNLPVKTERNI